MNGEYVTIYRNINKDITIGNFTAQEIAIPIAIFLFNYLFRFGVFFTFFCGCVSIYAMLVIKEYNQTRIKGYIKDFLWWYGLLQNKKNYPPSFARELT